jgi:hypothetical protein
MDGDKMGILKIMGLLCIAIMGLGLGLSLVMPVAATEEATTWELELAGATALHILISKIMNGKAFPCGI